MTAYPIFRGSDEAPITATDRGLKYSSGSSGRSPIATSSGQSSTITRASTAQPPALVEAEGVDVELDHARRLLEEPDHGEDRLHEPLLVPRLHAAVAGDQGVAVDLADHAPDLGLVDREDPEGDVLHQLDEGAAHAEGQDPAEGRVRLAPDDQLEAGRGLLLDEHARDLGAGVVGPCRLDDLRERGRGLLGRADADDHAARVGLVDDLGRDDLHHDRETDPFGRRSRRLGRGHVLERRHGHAVVAEQVVAFGLAEHSSRHGNIICRPDGFRRFPYNLSVIVAESGSPG